MSSNLRKIGACAAAIVVLLAVLTQAQTASKPAAVPPVTPAQAAKNELLNKRFVSQVQPVLTQFCYGCHGNGKKKGDLTLDRFTSLQIVLNEKKVWTNVSDMLEQHSMPPDNKPQPSDE